MRFVFLLGQGWCFGDCPMDSIVWQRNLMHGSRKFCERGSRFFFSWWGDRGSKYHYKWAIIGPPAKRHLNGVSLAGRWWPKHWMHVIFQWIRTSIAKKPYIFVIFQGGLCPPLWLWSDVYWYCPYMALLDLKTASGCWESWVLRNELLG